MHSSTEKLLIAINELTEASALVLSSTPKEAMDKGDIAARDNARKLFAKIFNVKKSDSESVQRYTLEIDFNYLRKVKLLDIDGSKDEKKIKATFFHIFGTTISNLQSGMYASALAEKDDTHVDAVTDCREIDSGFELYVIPGMKLDESFAQMSALSQRAL